MHTFVKMLTAGVVSAAALSGCTTVDYKTEHPSQGKIWRMEVTGPAIAYTNMVPTEGGPGEFEKYSGATPELMQGRRIAPTRLVMPNWKGTMIFPYARIPDSVANEDILKGSIVDVLMQPAKTLNYPTGRVTRIVRLVCRHSDKECISRVKKEGTLYTVIDENPADGAQFGQTYNYQMTTQELFAYHAWAKKQ